MNPQDADPLTLPEVGQPERRRTYRVRLSSEMFFQLGATAVDWGEIDAEGFYTPTVWRRVRLRNWLIRWLDRV